MYKNKKISILIYLLAALVLIVSLLPLGYCGFFDYATGDDLGKSADVHFALKGGAPFFTVIKVAARSAYNVWLSHEGTWASNFVLAFQPGVWGERVYAITPFIAIAFLALSIGYALQFVILDVLKYPGPVFLLLFPISLILAYQYMPYIRGGMFWFTGMAHYDIPFAIGIIYLVWVAKYLYTGKFRYVIPILLSAFYLGGSHYQAILMVLLMMPVVIFVYFLLKDREDWKKAGVSQIVIISLATVLIIAGFIVCAIAPGNTARAESDFSFTMDRAVSAVLMSISQSTIDGINYLIQPGLAIIFAILALVLGFVYGDEILNKKRKFYIPICIYLYLMYCAMYAPGMYYTTFGASEGISGGYYDYNYFVFILMLAVVLLLLGSLIGSLVKSEKKTIVFNIALVVCAVLCVVFSKSIIKKSAAYMCYEYITSGQLSDFDDQMQERLAILEDDSIKEVVLPEMNDQQGPFMHMPLTSDPDNFTNSVTTLYYGKTSVIAIPRSAFLLK